MSAPLWHDVKYQCTTCHAVGPRGACAASLQVATAPNSHPTRAARHTTDESTSSRSPTPEHVSTYPPDSRRKARNPHPAPKPLPGESPPPPAMPTAGLKTIIALSFVLAVGFLLVILSCALFKVYYPLLVVATYILAPVPNWICGRCANPDDFVESSGGAVLDLGRFFTGFFVVMGIGALYPAP